jgi:hypothetical protein
MGLELNNCRCKVQKSRAVDAAARVDPSKEPIEKAKPSGSKDRNPSGEELHACWSNELSRLFDCSEAATGY